MVSIVLVCMKYFIAVWKANLITILMAQCFASFLDLVIHIIIALSEQALSCVEVFDSLPLLQGFDSFFSLRLVWLVSFCVSMFLHAEFSSISLYLYLVLTSTTPLTFTYGTLLC